MLIFIIIVLVILSVSCVIGDITIGKSTKYYTGCVLDEIDNHKREDKENDTFFNHD